MILSVDIGNTFTKLAVVKAGEVVGHRISRHENLKGELGQVLTDYSGQIRQIGWINVNRKLDLGAYLDEWNIPCAAIDQETIFPIKNAYATPETLGTDRIVAVIGAQQLVHGGAVLVIDAGTAITYDYADEEGTYHGGGIGPGMGMRFQALHEFTARLPLLEKKEEIPLIGKSTSESIRSGVINGMTAEIDGIISRYEDSQKGKLHVILTGGDASFFEKRLKNINFASSNLIHLGIYHILTHQST